MSCCASHGRGRQLFAEHGSYRESLSQQACATFTPPTNCIRFFQNSTAIHVEIRRFFSTAGTLEGACIKAQSQNRQPPHTTPPLFPNLPLPSPPLPLVSATHHHNHYHHHPPAPPLTSMRTHKVTPRRPPRNCAIDSASDILPFSSHAPYFARRKSHRQPLCHGTARFDVIRTRQTTTRRTT